METAPFDATPHHQRLARLVGRWRGVARTFFEPSSAPEVAPWDATIELLLGGRFLRMRYVSRVMGKPIAGELTIAREIGERRWLMSWIDSFHTSPAILASEGARDDEAIRASGTYFAGEGHPRWGWRTEVHDERAPASLRIVMTNISPEGEESAAIEIELEPG
ncbi:DUF1579 family protein [Sandaracinus amylolyticus]|uniref:DUF1579 domain-containing protein n=1 Tax=Sandaracinus amylolyticus TaxID=927083 RepID=A0A0F6W575_9BACT|nr:DUF1579 family protein [Sandaracinus amylolyticus]AKF07787.1 hypothetical protein DB32_004936 [Sandaracinus amylolyticus]